MPVLVIQRLLLQRQATHYKKGLQRALTYLRLPGNKNSSPPPIQDNHMKGQEHEDQNKQLSSVCRFTWHVRVSKTLFSPCFPQPVDCPTRRRFSLLGWGFISPQNSNLDEKSFPSQIQWKPMPFCKKIISDSVNHVVGFVAFSFLRRNMGLKNKQTALDHTTFKS